MTNEVTDPTFVIVDFNKTAFSVVVCCAKTTGTAKSEPIIKRVTFFIFDKYTSFFCKVKSNVRINNTLSNKWEVKKHKAPICVVLFLKKRISGKMELSKNAFLLKKSPYLGLLILKKKRFQAFLFFVCGFLLKEVIVIEPFKPLSS